MGLQQLPMDTYRTLSFQIPDRHRNAVFGRYAQKQVNMIRHRFTFQQLYSFLLTQFSKNLTNFSTQTSIKLASTVFWQYHNMLLTLPLDVGLTLPFFHGGSPCPSGPTSSENHYPKITQETAEPFEFSPAKPVDYGRFRIPLRRDFIAYQRPE